MNCTLSLTFVLARLDKFVIKVKSAQGSRVNNNHTSVNFELDPIQS